MFDNINLILTLGLLSIALFWVVTDPRGIKERTFSLLSPRILITQLIPLIIIFLHLFYLQFISINLGQLNKILEIIGVFLFLIGLIITIYSKINMGKNWGIPAQLDSRRQDLVTGGLYRFSRNPMYVGFLLVAFGYFLALRSYLILALVVLFLLINKAAEKEERLLEKRFGKKYLKYKSSVPRFI